MEENIIEQLSKLIRENHRLETELAKEKLVASKMRIAVERVLITKEDFDAYHTFVGRSELMLLEKIVND